MTLGVLAGRLALRERRRALLLDRLGGFCEFARAQSGRIAFFGGALSGTAPWGHSQRPAGNCATGHVLSGVSPVLAYAAGSGSARAGFFERTHRESCAADSPAMGERGVRSAKLVS